MYFILQGLVALVRLTDLASFCVISAAPFIQNIYIAFKELYINFIIRQNLSVVCEVDIVQNQDYTCTSGKVRPDELVTLESKSIVSAGNIW